MLSLEFSRARSGEDSQTEGALATCLVRNESFRYTERELQFYEKHGIPRPRLSFAARYRRRIEIMDTSFYANVVAAQGSEEGLNSYFRHPQQLNIVSNDEFLKLLL